NTSGEGGSKLRAGRADIAAVDARLHAVSQAVGAARRLAESCLADAAPAVRALLACLARLADRAHGHAGAAAVDVGLVAVLHVVSAGSGRAGLGVALADAAQPVTRDDATLRVRARAARTAAVDVGLGPALHHVEACRRHALALAALGRGRVGHAVHVGGAL